SGPRVALEHLARRAPSAHDGGFGQFGERIGEVVSVGGLLTVGGPVQPVRILDALHRLVPAPPPPGPPPPAPALPPRSRARPPPPPPAGGGGAGARGRGGPPRRPGAEGGPPPPPPSSTAGSPPAPPVTSPQSDTAAIPRYRPPARRARAAVALAQMRDSAGVAA